MKHHHVDLKRLVLFDIDGTLVSCGPQVRPFFRAAIEESFGTAGDFDSYSFAGKTDPQIVTDLVRGEGFSDDQIASSLPRVRKSYLERLEAGLDRDRMRLLPGVIEILERLAERAEVAVGLLTGNWESGGRIKLSRFDLNPYFEFGAFGDGQPNRLGLPAVALDRVESQTGRRFAHHETLLIGDSRLDVECALENDIPLLAVATGVDSAENLRSAGAETVVADLTANRDYEHLLE